MSLYLDLLKRTLTRTLFMEGEAFDKRSKGLDWPGQGDAETMIGLERLTNIEELGGNVIDEDVPGDFVECGVWRGGATIFMAGVLADSDYLNDPTTGRPRCVWVCDSFEGCPEGNPNYPQDQGDPHHTFKFLSVSENEVRRNFQKYNLLDDNIKFVKGWFENSLPGPIEKIALLRADGDLYSSQSQILNALYDRVSPGGYVIIDDYYNIAGSHHAVNDFREKRGITSPMIRVDWCAAYWRKE